VEPEPVTEKAATPETVPLAVELYVAWVLVVAWATSLLLAGMGTA
jgi:hypothetical protein